MTRGPPPPPGSSAPSRRSGSPDRPPCFVTDATHTVKDANGNVVTRKDGTPRYVFEKAIHDFGRTAARNLSRAGVRRDVAKAITGHKTDIMFSRYNITDEADLREGMEKVSAYVATRPTQDAE
jgi:hypothetical protein